MMVKTIYVKAEVKLPGLPTYLLYDGPGDGKLDIADTTDEALTDLAIEWGKALVAKAQERRKNRPAAEHPF